MQVVTENKNRIMAGNVAITLALVLLTFGCWNEFSWYQRLAPLGTLISFGFMAVACLCYVDIKAALRDKELYLIGACDVIALFNLIIIKSNMGAVLTVACLSMMLYLSDKVRLPKKWNVILFCYIGFYFFYWTIDVKGYFKGYNTNYGGLVLITGFAFSLIMIMQLRQYLENKNRKLAMSMYAVLMIAMFVVGYKIIAWYRARCALLGLLTLLLIFLIPAGFLAKKYIYSLVVYGASLGAIAVSLIYVWLGRMKDTFTIRIFYKDIISGREEIWSELWGEYIKHPLTGIGSAYTMKLEWMEGMFEVHNGLLDILIVHGIVVFAICAYLLIKRLFMMRKIVAVNKLAKITFAGIICMLVSSFLENFFIVPPFTLCILLLFAQMFTIQAENDIIS